ncbi:MAG: MoaD/ThiS family protein [Acidobacteria bacterium]|nr:MoaD/ThiS family protein [Acidobacteriota bacterium]MDA1235615.1 MoaD/ThiS family protein [Acidobacteriota bacterium]
MPTVFIPTALRSFADGQESIEVVGSTVREVVNNLDPDLRAELLDGAKLKPNLAVAVDGAVAPLGLLERVEADSEIHFIAAISGGAEGQ